MPPSLPIRPSTSVLASLALAALFTSACKESSTSKANATTHETSAATSKTSANNETASSDEEAKETAPEDSKSADAAASGKIEALPFDKSNPDASWPAAEKGWGLVAGLHWRDARGENLLLSTSSRGDSQDHMSTEEIATRHWRKEGSEWKEVRKLRERVDSCEVDILLRAEVSEEWSLTDLDSDGVAEVTFATTSACSGDLSPSTHKVLLIEDGEKFALRGTNQVMYDEGAFLGGEYKETEDFTKAPEAFQKHIKMVWEKTALVDKSKLDKKKGK